MKHKKAQVGGILMSGVVAVIVGVAMLPIFASLIDDAQDIETVAYENITNTEYNQSFNLDQDHLVVGTIVVLNSTCEEADSCTSNNATLRDGIEFTINEITGTLIIVNRTGMWNVSYDWTSASYIDSATGRVVVRNVTLMYAVALILITLASVGIYLVKK